MCRGANVSWSRMPSHIPLAGIPLPHPSHAATARASTWGKKVKSSRDPFQREERNEIHERPSLTGEQGRPVIGPPGYSAALFCRALHYYLLPKKLWSESMPVGLTSMPPNAAKPGGRAVHGIRITKYLPIRMIPSLSRAGWWRGPQHAVCWS